MIRRLLCDNNTAKQYYARQQKSELLNDYDFSIEEYTYITTYIGIYVVITLVTHLNPVTGTFPAPWGVSVIKKDWKFDTPLLAAGQFILA